MRKLCYWHRGILKLIVFSLKFEIIIYVALLLAPRYALHALCWSAALSPRVQCAHLVRSHQHQACSQLKIMLRH